MHKMKNIFKKFILITGVLNFPIGLMMIIPAFMNPNPDTLITTAVVGAFIMFAGASLIWSSRDLQTRASIVLWNGLVRGFGVITVSYTASIGHVPVELIVVTFLDFMLFIICTFGSVKVTGIPFRKLVLGKN